MQFQSKKSLMPQSQMVQKNSSSSELEFSSLAASPEKLGGAGAMRFTFADNLILIGHEPESQIESRMQDMFPKAA